MAPKSVPFPCIRCKKNVAKANAVGCATCGQWVHKECEDLSDDVFNILARKVGGIKWHCQSCEASSVRLEAAIKQVETRLNAVEDRMGATEERTKLVEAKADNAVLVAEQAKGAAAGVKDDISKIVFEELSEREDRKNNIIMHNFGESDSMDLVVAKKWDEDSFNNVTAAMGVNLTFQESATFSRRLGAGSRDPNSSKCQSSKYQTLEASNILFVKQCVFTADVTNRQTCIELARFLNQEWW